MVVHCFDQLHDLLWSSSGARLDNPGIDDFGHGHAVQQFQLVNFTTWADRADFHHLALRRRAFLRDRGDLGSDGGLRI